MSIHWEYEDHLPEMDKMVYRAMFRTSMIIDGVRMFPYIIIDDERRYLLSIE